MHGGNIQEENGEKEVERRKMTSGSAKGLSFIHVLQYQAHSRCLTNISDLESINE